MLKDTSLGIPVSTKWNIFNLYSTHSGWSVLETGWSFWKPFSADHCVELEGADWKPSHQIKLHPSPSDSVEFHSLEGWEVSWAKVYIRVLQRRIFLEEEKADLEKQKGTEASSNE